MTNSKFIKECLKSGCVMSEVQMMNKYAKRRYNIFLRTLYPANISKKLESIRKQASLMRKQGIIKETYRIEKGRSSEIFYKMI